MNSEVMIKKEPLVMSSPPIDVSLVASSGPVTEPKVTRGHSCVLCRRRKIKCDGQHPCQNCIKARTVCTAPEIVPARRRKTKQEIIANRLRRCEEIIRKAGLKVEDDDDENIGVDDAGELWEGKSGTMSVIDGGESRDFEGGKLIVEKGQSRYIESSIWESIDSEVREDSIHLIQHSAETDTADPVSTATEYSSLLFGRLMVSNSLTASHPSPIHIFRLWQTFVNNINPLTKVIHAPTIQEVILEAIGEIDKISTSTEALMFAIYHCAVVSLDDQECREKLEESRSSALMKYSAATQQALVNAKVLRTSNVMVLQALTLYLLSIRQFTDPDTLWSLAGLAIRIACRIGLHRDTPSSKLSILDLEIRRRLWWQIMTLEGHSTSLSGSSGPSAIATFPAAPLLNINDSDLTPSMTSPPAEHNGITEMLFCCIRREIGVYMFSSIHKPSLPSTPQAPSTPTPSPSDVLAAKLKDIDDLETRLYDKYVKNADPSVPLHFLSLLVVRSALSKIRLRLYTHPRMATARPLPQASRDAGFALSVEILAQDDDGHSGPAKLRLKGFMWHIRVFFQLEAFIYMLSELRTRTTGADAERAWRLVEATYAHHEEILRDTANKLWFAVGNLCLKAWEQRAKALRAVHGAHGFERPACVLELCVQRGVDVSLVMMEDGVMGLPGSGHSVMGSQGLGNSGMGAAQYGKSLPSAQMPSYDSFEMGDVGSMDWAYWQTLFDQYEVPLFSN